MNILLIGIALFLICLQHVFASALPFCFFVVIYLARHELSIVNILGVWILGLLLDLSLGVHIGASAFSFLSSFIILVQVRRLITVDSRMRLLLFSLLGLSLQHLLYAFSLSFVLNDSFTLIAGYDFLYFAILALPFAFLLPKKRW